MLTVGTYEAKTHFAQLLSKVSDGETVTITRNGKPIARLIPATVPLRSKAEVQDIAAAFRKLRKKVKRGKPTAVELVRMGRKY